MPKILIIDDERSIRRTLKEILEFESYEVEAVEDGIAGVKEAMANQYDVIFCDIKIVFITNLKLNKFFEKRLFLHFFSFSKN